MRSFLASFIVQLASVAWTCFRYLLASLTIMLLSMSLMTKQFPPPIMSIYKTLKDSQGVMNFGESTALIAKAKADQEKLLKDIDDDQKGASTVAGNLASGTAPQSPEAEQRIKSLEYEVALLKSKLYRAEWEAQQLRAQSTASAKK